MSERPSRENMNHEEDAHVDAQENVLPEAKFPHEDADLDAQEKVLPEAEFPEEDADVDAQENVLPAEEFPEEWYEEEQGQEAELQDAALGAPRGPPNTHHSEQEKVDHSNLQLVADQETAADMDLSQLSQVAPSQDGPAECDERLGFRYRPTSHAMSRIPDPLLRLLPRLEACGSEPELGELLEPKQLFINCENGEKLYGSTFVVLQKAVAAQKDVLEVGDDPAFDIGLLAPTPIIVALQTICGAQGWCLEATLQGHVVFFLSQ